MIMGRATLATAISGSFLITLVLKHLTVRHHLRYPMMLLTTFVFSGDDFFWLEYMKHLTNNYHRNSILKAAYCNL